MHRDMVIRMINMLIDIYMRCFYSTRLYKLPSFAYVNLFLIEWAVYGSMTMNDCKQIIIVPTTLYNILYISTLCSSIERSILSLR